MLTFFGSVLIACSHAVLVGMVTGTLSMKLPPGLSIATINIHSFIMQPSKSLGAP